MLGFTLETLLGRVLGLVIGFSLHEWAHAWSAYQLGDRTAYYQGRLTLDPRAHIEPVGIILALVAGFGWAKPVPVNPRAFYPNEKRGLVIVSLAGPVMNLLIAFAFGLLVRVMLGLGLDDSLSFIFNIVVTIVVFNLVLFLFNLLPFSPLDGYKIAVGTLPREYSDWLIQYERETTFALMLLLMIGIMNANFNLLWVILGPPLRFLFQIVTGA